MAHHLSPEEKKILKLVEKVITDDATRKTWEEEIQTNGLTEETAEAIRKALSTVPEGEQETAEMARGRLLIEFTALVKRWRFAYQAKNFGRR
ncbi:MAG: hypothetical protein WC837_02990 [Bellilinea sp.]